MHRCIMALCLTAFLAAQSAPEVEITAEPHHHLALTNDRVRVFNVDIPPHADTLMHRHRHDYIFVTLGASEVINAVQGKDAVTVKLQDGQTGFLTGGYAHIARNVSAQPFRNVTVELLQDDKLRRSPFKWNATRGLDILHGGTKEILFVKDGIRVSEFELQPDAAVPSVRPSYPLLLVAVTDLDLYTTDPRTHGPPQPDAIAHHFQAGGLVWLPHGFGRPITNAGPHNAKFVTLEFPKE